MSGIGGESGELLELLSTMKEERDDSKRVRVASAAAVRERDALKEELGAVLVASASRRKLPAESGERRSSTARKTQKATVGDDKFSAFASSLAESDRARMELDRERLQFERERFESDLAEREKERELRREETREAQKADLEKFRLMLEIFKNK